MGSGEARPDTLVMDGWQQREGPGTGRAAPSESDATRGAKRLLVAAERWRRDGPDDVCWGSDGQSRGAVPGSSVGQLPEFIGRAFLVATGNTWCMCVGAPLQLAPRGRPGMFERVSNGGNSGWEAPRVGDPSPRVVAVLPKGRSR